MALFSSLKDLNLNPLDTISNLFKTGYSVYQDQRNFNYQKDLQQELFKRDDTAMQRRMADLRSAGINPLMALGSSGSSNTSAGGASGYPINVNENFFSDQQKAKIERDTMKQEIDKRKIEMEQMKINLRAGKIANWSAMQDLNTKRLEQDILKKQIEQMNNSGVYPLSGFGKNYVDFQNLLLPFLQSILKSSQYTYEKNFSPEKIEDIKEATSNAVENFVNFMRKPVFGYKKTVPVSVARKREYEARVLRDSSDRNIHYPDHVGVINKSGKFGKKIRQFSEFYTKK